MNSSQGVPLVAVVVPIYNRIVITREFLKEFEGVSYPSYKMIVVDDGSPDGSADIIAREFPWVDLIRTSGDLWWTRATNIGVTRALETNAEFVLTINDDVSFEKDFLSHLVSRALTNPGTLVGSCIFDYDDHRRIWYAGGRISYLQGELFHRRHARHRKLRWLTGMGVLIPAGVFRTIGLYDETRFPHYFADADLSLRAHRAGFKLAIEERSIVYNRIRESADETIRRRATLRTFFTPLFTIRSVAYFPTRLQIYGQHWPFLLKPIGLIMYYVRFFAKRMLRLLRLR